MVLGALVALFLDHLLALARGLAADGHVLGDLALRAARLHHAIQACAQALGQLAPRKTEHQRNGQHRTDDAQQARTRKAQPLHGQRAQNIAERATGMAGQQALETVHARPLQRRAGGQKQQHPAPEHQAHGPRAAPATCALAPLVGCAHPAGQGRQPASPGRGHEPPHGKAQQKIAHIGQPGSQPARQVDGLACALQAGARGGPGGILGRIAHQGEQPEHQGNQPYDQAHLLPEARGP
jgi:hypothetical protein